MQASTQPYYEEAKAFIQQLGTKGVVFENQEQLNDAVELVRQLIVNAEKRGRIQMMRHYEGT